MKKVRFNDKVQIQYVDKIDLELNNKYQNLDEPKPKQKSKKILFTSIFVILVLLILIAICY
tara:strand:- start:3358 stop:3540 length:183 start_codon:yes stop_codon:yes gene_type:complete